MASNDPARICWAALILAFVVGCKDRKVSSQAETSPAIPGFLNGGTLTKKYYPSMKKEQVDRAMSSEIEKESEVVAILGEPTERSATKKWFNEKYGMNMEEYVLTWNKAEGTLAVQVTFLNNRKTRVISAIGG